MFWVSGRDLGKEKYFYPDDQEIMPSHITEYLSKYVVIKSYVDANKSGNMGISRPHYDIIIFVNNATMICYSKLQNTVEASSYGSEFVALWIATEMIEDMRYKLRCLGVLVNGLVEVFCDNKSVVKNSGISSSVLNKRHNNICYHSLRGSQAEDVLHVEYI